MTAATSKSTRTSISGDLATATETLAAKYRQLTRISAENIIELGKTVCQAKQLGIEAHRSFCTAVNLDPSGSTCRKHVLIGERADQFAPYIDRMPVSWTTIYKLACLEDEEFELVASNDKFSPTITANEINEIIGQPVGAKGAASEFTITVDLVELCDDDKRAVYSEIEMLRESHPFKIRCSEALNQIVGAESSKSNTGAKLAIAA